MFTIDDMLSILQNLIQIFQKIEIIIEIRRRFDEFRVTPNRLRVIRVTLLYAYDPLDPRLGLIAEPLVRRCREPGRPRPHVELDLHRKVGDLV